MRAKVKEILWTALEYVFWFFPVKNKIVFNNFNGRGFGCNPKYIALGCIDANLDAELVWLGSKYYDGIPKEISQVLWGSLRFYYELATAKVIVTNVTNLLPVIKKKKQYWIETWHGSFSPKMLEFDAQESLSSDYIKGIKKMIPQIDLFLSNSGMQTQEYRNAFKYEGEIMKYGYPRNDCLVNANVDTVNSIKNKLHLENKKIVLYMPTFRGDGDMHPYDINVNAVMESVVKRFQGEWIFAVRLHPNIADKKIKNNGIDIDFTNYPDPQELLLIADILITDYSTVMFDFSIMDKPVFLFANDIKKYSEKIRRLKPIFWELPFPLAESSVDLCEKISDFNESAYRRQVKNYMSVYNSAESGKATIKIVDKMIMVMKEK